MNPETGRILTEGEVKNLPKAIKDQLVPLGFGEVVEIKGFKFKVVYIRTDRCRISLEPLVVIKPKLEKQEEIKK